MLGDAKQKFLWGKHDAVVMVVIRHERYRTRKPQSVVATRMVRYRPRTNEPMASCNPGDRIGRPDPTWVLAGPRHDAGADSMGAGALVHGPDVVGGDLVQLIHVVVQADTGRWCGPDMSSFLPPGIIQCLDFEVRAPMFGLW